MSKPRLGFLGACNTEHCGPIEGYFCVRCRHYVQDCRCQPASCACADGAFWASKGEIADVTQRFQKALVS